MKFTQLLKYSFASALICFLFIYFSACKQETRPEDTKEVAQDKNEAKFENTKEDDAEFLVDVAEFNLQQAELGKLTTVKSNNADIKAFGKMMQERHNANLKDLNVLAASKQISIPASLTDDNKDNYNALNKKDIDDFDKDYLDRIVKEHTEAIDEYTEEIDKTTDPEVKKWLVIHLASLREHLDNAMTLQSKFEKR
jgi:putative membrane protein